MSDNSDKIDHLAKVRAALEAADLATPGPWEARESPRWLTVYEKAHDIAAPSVSPVSRDQSSQDAAAIVALRNAAGSIAAVADELERMRAALERANSQIFRLASGQSIESDVIRQHLEADVAALHIARAKDARIDQLRAEVERLTAERDEARQALASVAMVVLAHR